jgi:hypothetical protein
MHKIELFRANCKLCDYTEREVRKAVRGEYMIVVYRPEDCVDGSCCIKAESYGVKAVPSIVIDGKLAATGKIGSGEIKKILGS